MYEWKHVVTIKIVIILMGSTFRNEYMYKDTKKICKGHFLEEVHVMLWAIPTTKILSPDVYFI